MPKNETIAEVAARTGETVEQVTARRAAREVARLKAMLPNASITTKVVGPIDPRLARAPKTSSVLVLS